MAKVTRVQQAGDQLILFYDDGTRAYAVASGGNNWSAGSPAVKPVDPTVPPVTPSGQFIWPFQYSKWVIQTGTYAKLAQFGMRVDPVTGKTALHAGLDFGAGGISGKPIIAAADGTVTDASYSGPQGNHVHLSHAGGFDTWYFHMVNLPNVKTGQTVKQGDVLGNVGSTGWSTGAHLHWETHVNGTPVNPRQFMKDRGNPES